MNNIGNTITIVFFVKDSTGALVDADSLPVATVTLPDATTSTPTVTHVSTGKYSFKYLPAVGGEFGGKAVGTVAGDSFNYPCDFTVWDPARWVVSLDDAKQHLNITVSTTDDELSAFVVRAQSAVEARVGPLTPNTYTRRLGRDLTSVNALVLPVTPVISLTSVTSVIGLNVATTNLTVSTSGVVTGIYGWSFAGAYDVVWVAGRASIPGDLYLAVLEMLRHLWSTQRGGASRANRVGDSLANTVPESAYSWPFRVQQLLAPYEQPGFA